VSVNEINGNLAVPLGARIGFGLPPYGSDEPSGPQILVVAADPNGSVVAPKGTLALDLGAPTLWQNLDGGTAWVLAGGNASVRAQVIVSNTPVVVPANTSIAANISPLNPADGPTSFTVPADGDYVLDLRSTITSLPSV
jgi:hypothetical protein